MGKHVERFEERPSVDWPLAESATARALRNLFRARNAFWELDRKEISRHGLTWAQFQSLVALRRAPAPHRLSAGDLGLQAQVTSGGLTKLVDGLIEKNYVRRIDNPNDRRGRFVQLSAKGKRFVERVARQLYEPNHTLFRSALSEDELETLAGLLERLGTVVVKPREG
ncbi:MAG: MarR family transcriptional regulator [Pseudomonadota bacterium]